jgi:hypothetical protein
MTDPLPGHARPDVFKLEEQGIPIDNIVSATKLALSKMSPEQRTRST